MPFDRFWPAQFGTRRVLIAGFGGLLLLMALAGVDALIVISNLRSTNAAIRQRFLARNRLLEEIRGGIFLSGTYARDYLLAPEQSGADAQRKRLEETQQATEAAIAQYARAIDAGEVGPFTDLRGEIHAYWKLLGLILDWNTPEKRRTGFSYFYKELVRRRTAMLAIADRIFTLNEHELTLGDQHISGAFDSFRLSLVITLAITLAGGVLLASVTIARMWRLEQEADRRYQESARARSELKELSARLVNAQEQERKAISRELHDEVGQSLSALLVEAGNTAAMLPPGSAELHAHLDSVKRLAENSVHVIRNMALLLRPSMLDDLGLVPALEWQARETAKRTGMRVRVIADESVDQLPDEHKTCVYRIVQEALHNSARHAQARQVEVTVRAESTRIVLTVTDDGRGFDASRTRGLGLAGMEERVSHLGGFFAVESRADHGAIVRVELPLTPVAAGV